MNLKRKTLDHYDRILALLKSDEAKRRLSSVHESFSISIYLHERREAPFAACCPLCQRYESSCSKCPVARDNMYRIDCEDTPWTKITLSGSLDEYIAAVEKEREFLAGLDYSTGIIRWAKKTIETIRRSIRGQEKRN